MQVGSKAAPFLHVNCTRVSPTRAKFVSIPPSADSCTGYDASFQRSTAVLELLRHVLDTSLVSPWSLIPSFILFSSCAGDECVVVFRRASV